MSLHAMIDLETLGHTPNTVALTIGGCKFDPNVISPSRDFFYYRFEVDEQIERGRSTDSSTLEWWASQPDHVREEALGDENRTPVLDVLKALNKWCVNVECIWAQGPAFDIVILEDMFRQWDHHLPWPFWKIRDSRTLFQIMPKDPRKELEFDAHNALEDCKAQALCVQQSLQQLGLTIR